MSFVELPILAGNSLDPHAPTELMDAAGQLARAAQGPRDIRNVRTLRISVTDHCNFRCVYCMPAEGVEWLPKAELLTYEEMVTVARAALDHGIRDIKLTGGEPLLRKDLDLLVRSLRELPGAGELSLTTNGLLLDRFAPRLREAGLDRVTVSVDTLDRERFRAITGTGDLERVLEGVRGAEACGLGPVKFNVVVMRAYNADEVVDFAGITLRERRTVRFIEFMPLGKSRVVADEDQFVPYTEIRQRIEQAYGPLLPATRDRGSGPAHTFQLRGAAGKIGFIHAMSAPFCSACNRLRLTPDGQLRSCLFDGGEIDVRPLLRPTTREAALRRAFVECVVLRPDVHHKYGNRQMSQVGG